MKMQNAKDIRKVGIVAMPRISVGGGFARATRDLIAALNSMNKKVYLLNPFNVNLDRISKLYGPIKIEKIYGANTLKAFFCREDTLGRKLMKKQFQKMANEVDFIIDLDGGVFHNYIPNNFDKNNYVIWRLSCINPETLKIQKVNSSKVLAKTFIKNLIKKFSFSEKDIPKRIKIYAMDKWTKMELIEFWGVKPEKICLYPEIKVGDFNSKKKKEKLIVIFGRIAPNKSIIDSMKIFYIGTRKHLEYKLVILGGITPDSDNYIKKIKQKAIEFGISNKVEIISDPSFDKIKDILSRAKILIDSQKGVSLTMTSIEAMAAGCVVLARKNGGTYKEVLENGKYGAGFEDVENGSKKLYSILEHKSLNNNKSIKRAGFFSSENFKKRLRGILNE